MKLLLIIMFGLFIPQFRMPNVFTENKELCFNTFKEYLEVGKRRKEAIEFIKLMIKYSDESKTKKKSHGSGTKLIHYMLILLCSIA